MSMYDDPREVPGSSVPPDGTDQRLDWINEVVGRWIDEADSISDAQKIRACQTWLRTLLERVNQLEKALREMTEIAGNAIDEGVMNWHAADTDKTIYEWLGLTQDEYEAWVHKSGIWALSATREDAK